MFISWMLIMPSFKNSLISAVTYKHMGKGHVNEGPKGLSF